jgi:hypothetical protein
MFVSTREMLGRTSPARSSAEAIIRPKSSSRACVGTCGSAQLPEPGRIEGGAQCHRRPREDLALAPEIRAGNTPTLPLGPADHEPILITPPPDPGSLTAINSYARFDPAVGITYNVGRNLNTYFSYSEGNRVPTSIELGYADPTVPCRLPNALAGDPPLKQVSDTLWKQICAAVEKKIISLGARASAPPTITIFFLRLPLKPASVISRTSDRLYAKAQRSTLIVTSGGPILGGGDIFIDATCQSPEAIDGSGNSTNDQALAGTPGMEGVIQILPAGRSYFSDPAPPLEGACRPPSNKEFVHQSNVPRSVAILRSR